MKKRLFLCFVCSIILFTGLSPDASEQKLGTWKLVHVWGVLQEPNWFANHCELVTFSGNQADYYINGENKFSGPVDSLISRFYKTCTLSVIGDTLRFTRAQELEDLPFSWEWVRYSDLLLNFDGTWRWIETVGGIMGVSRTRSDYFSIFNVNGTDVVNYINDSIVFSGKRDSLLSSNRTRYNWIVVADTLIAFQKPQCCDIPYIFKWIRWTSGQSVIRVSNRSIAVPSNENPIYFDIRGRKVVSGSKSASGIHIMYNRSRGKMFVSTNTSKQIK